MKDKICKPCNQIRFNMQNIQTGTFCQSSGQDFTFQCRRYMFDPWLGSLNPTCLTVKIIKQKQYCNKFNIEFKEKSTHTKYYIYSA